MFEIWKSVKGDLAGWPYEVSSHGRVRRSGPKRKIRKHTHDKDGYPYLVLSYMGRPKCVRIHRLVAEAFLGKSEGGDQVNHKDGDKENNRPDNLEWCTCRENIHHAERIGLREFLPLGRFKRKLSDPQVVAIRELSVRGVTDIFMARWFGVSPPVVRSARLGMTYADVT